MKNKRVLAPLMAGFVILASFSPAVLAEDEYFDLDSEVYILDSADDSGWGDGMEYSDPGADPGAGSDEGIYIPDDQGAVEIYDPTQIDVPQGNQEVAQPAQPVQQVIPEDNGWDEEPIYTDDSVWADFDALISDDPAATPGLSPTPGAALSATPTPAGEELTPTPIAPVDVDKTKPIYVYTDGEDEEPQLTYTVDTIEEAIAKSIAAGLDMVDISISKNVTLDKTVEVPEGFTLTVTTEGDYIISRGASFTGSFFTVGSGAELVLTGNTAEVAQEGGTEEIKNYILTLDGMNISCTAPLVYVEDGGSLSVENGVVLTRNYSSHQGSAIYVAKDASSLSLAGCTITSNMSLANDGAAVYVAEGFAENFNIGDGSAVTVDGNSRIVDNNTVPANIYLAKAGEEASQITLTGDMAEDSKINVSVGNPSNGLPVVVDSEDGYVEDFATSMGSIFYEKEGFSLKDNGKLSDGTEPTETPTPAPTTTVTVTPTEAPGSATPTMTPVPIGTITPTPVPTSPGYVTATPTTPVTRSYYVPPVSSAADGYLVSGLDQPLEFPAGKNNTFEVTGASAETRYSSNLVVGDGKWSPYYWTSGNSTNRQNVPEDENAVYTRRTYNISHNTGLYNQSSTQTITLYFKLFTWGGTGWIPTSTVQSTQTRFTVAKITPTSAAGRATATTTPVPYYTATPTPYNNSNGTVSTNNTTDYLALTRAAQTPVPSVVSTAGTVNTADNSPVGAYVLLAVLSLLVSGYALIRRRKG